MTAEAMRWTRRLMGLLRDGKPFLQTFARHMYTIEEGVNRICWKDFATFIRKPEFFVDMEFEIINDDMLFKPMNAIYYDETNGYPAGFCIRTLPMRVHDTWRPLLERLSKDPLSIVKRGADAIDSLTDPQLRSLKRKQVQE